MLLDRLAERRPHPGARVSGAEALLLALGTQARHQVRREHRQRLGRRRQRLAHRQLGAGGVDRAALPQPLEQPVALLEQERRGCGSGGRARARSAAPRASRSRPRRAGLPGGRSSARRPRRGRRCCRRRARRRRRARAPAACGSDSESRSASTRLDRLLDERARLRPLRASRTTCIVSVLPPLTTRPPRRFWTRGARQGERVDAGVPVEASVLEAEDRLRELLGQLRGDAEAPLAVAGDRGPEELAVAVEHDRRERVVERHDRDQQPESEQQKGRRPPPAAGCVPPASAAIQRPGPRPVAPLSSCGFAAIPVPTSRPPRSRPTGPSCARRSWRRTSPRP